jgi:hypothetical protein
MASAPVTPAVDLRRDGVFVTDEHGIARAGIRTPHVDVPTAVLSSQGNSGNGIAGDLVGTTTPFEAAKLAALYLSRADYLSRFGAATDTAVAAGFVLPADAAEIKAIAAEVPAAIQRYAQTSV